MYHTSTVYRCASREMAMETDGISVEYLFHVSPRTGLGTTSDLAYEAGSNISSFETLNQEDCCLCAFLVGISKTLDSR